MKKLVHMPKEPSSGLRQSCQSYWKSMRQKTSIIMTKQPFIIASPDGSICHTKDKLTGSKKAMDRVTVLCCTNILRTDKQNHLVIGNSKRF